MRRQILFFSLLLSSLLWAQQGPKLTITIEDEKVNISPEEIKSGITTYSPGDTIQYDISSKNVGDALMTNPVITDPIPSGVSYVENSAVGPDSEILFSINEGKTYAPWPVYYSVRNSRGIIVRKRASADMVTHIRWKIQVNLEAGESHLAKFKVVVNP